MANKKMHHAVIGADTYEVIDQAARESIAENFDATTDYTAGEYVYNNAVLYRFTADHDAGAWTGTDAEEVKVGTEISTLNQSLAALGLSVVSGAINITYEEVSA